MPATLPLGPRRRAAAVALATLTVVLASASASARPLAAAPAAASASARPLAAATDARPGVRAAAPAGPLALAPCSRDPVDRSRCGRVTVPLDRTGALPGTVALRVRVLEPAAASNGAPRPPVIGLAGGPGQAAAPLLERFADVFGAVARSRRFVAFDQRGTGGSGRIACPALAAEPDPLAAVGACAAQLGPRRTAYTTAASVADLEAVRDALGADRVVLFGSSYGTKVALDYAAAHPDRVDRLVLDSVVPPAGVDPFQRATLASIGRVLEGICAGAAGTARARAATGCPFTRDPTADLAALVRRLASGPPLRGGVVDAHGRAHPVALGRAGLLALLLEGDLAPSLRVAYPAAVAAALRGDPAPMLRLAALARGGPGGRLGGDSDAVFVATTCADGAVPWPAGTAPSERAAATAAAAAAIPDAAFAPFDRETVRALGTADLCRHWPESPIAQPQAPLAFVPTLILSGDDDLRTPRADAVALAQALPTARLLRVPHAGHGVLGGEPTACAHRAVVAFVEDVGSGPATPAACDPRRGAIAPAPLAPRRLEEVAPPAGMGGGRAARTIRAVDRTLDDAIAQFGAAVFEGLGDPRGFGGLRAGRAAILPAAGLLLRAYAYVPGVMVTGLIPLRRPRFEVVVGGRAAVAGRLVVSRRGIAGTLGGRRVHATPAALGWPPIPRGR